MIDDELIKNEIIQEYDNKAFHNVVKLYERNSILIHEDYTIIGLIAFSYQEISDYKNAIKIIDSNLGIAHFDSMSSSDLDLIFLVGVNCNIELGRTSEAFKLTAFYLKLKGEHQELKKSFNNLKQIMIRKRMKILFRLVFVLFLTFYLVKLISKYLFFYNLIPNSISFPLTIGFCGFMYVYYNTKFFDNLFSNYYDKKAS